MVVLSLRAALLMLCTLVEWIMAECLQPCSARKASSTASSMLLTRTMGSTGMSISVMTKGWLRSVSAMISRGLPVKLTPLSRRMTAASWPTYLRLMTYLPSLLMSVVLSTLSMSAP